VEAENTDALKTEAAAEAAEDLKSVVQPAANAGVAELPRQTPAPPTAAPRKMDTDALLPFFLQTESDPAFQPDGIFKPPVEADAEPLLFAMPSGLPAAVESPATSDDAEEPLVSSLIISAAAAAPAAAAAEAAPAPAAAAAAPAAAAAAAATPAPLADEEEEPLVASLMISAAAAAPAPAIAQAATPTTPAPPGPTAWETGEPMPSSTLAILAGSPMTTVTVSWNGLELPSSEREGSWTKVQLSGKSLVEGCWCDRAQLGNYCKDRLRKQAPQAIKLYYHANECLLRISTNGMVLHEMEVGLAGSATPAQMERAMEEAADAAEVAEGPRQAAAGSKGAASLLTMASAVPHFPVILPM